MAWHIKHILIIDQSQRIGLKLHLPHGSEEVMDKIDNQKHKELIIILSELIETIELMKAEEKDYLLIQNENEAKDWLEFLKKHTDKDELKSLENEISNRFFFRFDVQIGTSELDNKRAELMKKYILKSNEYL